jgi:hypothetical protein
MLTLSLAPSFSSSTSQSIPSAILIPSSLLLNPVLGPASFFSTPNGQPASQPATTMKKTLGVAAALYAASVSADPASHCVGDNKNICFQWGVPQAAVSSGSGNLYFQLRAPTEYSWVGLGIGRAMAGADIFVVYQNGSDGGVTLSPRAGRGHVMPEYNQQTGLDLLPGSGITDGEMIANVRCSSCSSSLELGGSNSWISAWHRGDALDSTDPEQRISVHDDKIVFTVDLAQATISSDENPFVTSSNGDNGGQVVNKPSPGNNGSGGSAIGTDNSQSNTDTIILAHGIIMTIVFAAGYPIGALLMPLVRKWFIHASWQMLVFLLMWVGFALGYIASDRKGIFSEEAHTVLGTFVVALMGLQPVLGWLHHRQFKKTQRRGVFSRVHTYYGQFLMLVGIINGGVGLALAGASTGYKAAYSVVAVVFGLLYIGVVVMGRFRSGSKGQPVAQRGPKMSDGSTELSNRG